MTIENSKLSHKTANSWSVHFFARLAGFGQLGLIKDPHIIFQKSQNELNDHNGPEKNTLDYGRHTGLTPAAIKINRF